MKKQLLSFVGALLVLTVNAQTNEPFPNGGFENWGSGNTPTPSSFNSLNPSTTILGIVTCTKATPPDVYSGSFGVKLRSAAYAAAPGGVIQGMMTTGNINPIEQNIQGGIPFTSRPDSVVAWAKYTPALNSQNAPDTGYVEILLLNDATTDTIGRGRFNIFTEVTSFTRFSAPIQYFSTDSPARLRAIINSSSGYSPVANSELFIDEAAFIYNPLSSINPRQNDNVNVFVDSQTKTLVIKQQDLSFKNISIFSLTGNCVVNNNIENQNIFLPVNELPNGVYIYRMSNASITKVGRILINF